MQITEKQLLSSILSLTKKLIAIPSTNNNREDLHKVLSIAENELGGNFFMEKFESNGIPSLLVHNGQKRMKQFKLLLNAHLDVVPAKQYKAIEKDGKLYGRGTFDMKAAAAVMILLFKNLAKDLPYPLALQLVTDEEIGGYNGTLHQIKKGIRTDFFIMGEPSWLKMNNAAKGVIWIKLSTKGNMQHAAYPWKGENAIVKMQELAKRLEKLYPSPNKEAWKTTIVLSRIETSNRTTNAIPDDCTAHFDIRYIPSEREHIIQKIKSVIPEDVEFEVVVFDEAFYTPKDNPYFKKLIYFAENTLGDTIEYLSTNGSADSRHFEAVNCKGVCFGLDGEGHHSDNEWVDIKSIEQYTYILKNFLSDIT